MGRSGEKWGGWVIALITFDPEEIQENVQRIKDVFSCVDSDSAVQIWFKSKFIKFHHFHTCTSREHK